LLSKVAFNFYLHRYNKGAVIECSGHDPITAGDYILGRIKSNFTA
jgi:hypothetical protein